MTASASTLPEPLWPPAAPRIAVVVPCYRVREQVAGVLARIGPEVGRIYCVDDACPEGTGEWLRRSVTDPRVSVLQHVRNEGVGGATITGLRAALADEAMIVVKVDGDGQMDPALIGRFVRPILSGQADYTKGSRFHRLTGVRGMPVIRLLANALLSFVTKFSSGYWNVFDPANGYLAIHSRVAELLPFNRIARGYLFESDLLHHLYALRAVVADIPMEAVYGTGKSGARFGALVIPFLTRHAMNSARRIVYGYFLNDFSIASVELVIGAASLMFGVVFGGWQWAGSYASGIPSTAGTVMLAALPVIFGVQFLLGFLSYDIQQTPRLPVHRLLEP